MKNRIAPRARIVVAAQLLWVAVAVPMVRASAEVASRSDEGGAPTVNREQTASKESVQTNCDTGEESIGNARMSGREARGAILWEGGLRFVELVMGSSPLHGPQIDTGADSNRAMALSLLDAETGRPLWRSAPLTFPAALDSGAPHASLPPSLLVSPTGLATRAYFVTDDGYLWRLDLPPDAAPVRGREPVLYPVAKLSDGVSLRLRSAPELVYAIDEFGRAFTGLLLVVEPLDESSVQASQLIYLRDYHVSSSQGPDAGKYPELIRHGDLLDIRACMAQPLRCDATRPAGWWVPLPKQEHLLVDRPSIVDGRVFVGLTTAAHSHCSQRNRPDELWVLELNVDRRVLAGHLIISPPSAGAQEAQPTPGLSITNSYIDSEHSLQTEVQDISSRTFRLYWRDLSAKIR